ncbi:hypothetical protein WMF30_10485 [Sorangium sp. So ce134]
MQVKSWKTTLAGAIAGIALLAQAAELPAWLRLVAWALAGLGAAALGALSRDNDKSSEEVGAAKTVTARGLAPGEVLVEVERPGAPAVVGEVRAAAPPAPQDTLPDVTPPREGQ